MRPHSVPGSQSPVGVQIWDAGTRKQLWDVAMGPGGQWPEQRPTVHLASN